MWASDHYAQQLMAGVVARLDQATAETGGLGDLTRDSLFNESVVTPAAEVVGETYASYDTVRDFATVFGAIIEVRADQAGERILDGARDVGCGLIDGIGNGITAGASWATGILR